MAKRVGSQTRSWLPADSALWQTCQIVADINARRVPELRTSTMFPLRGNEIAFATGPVTVESFHAVGDGSYSSHTAFVGGTGLFGLAMGAATLAGSAIGNSSRRAQAAANATAVWRPILQGSVVVCSKGFFLVTPTQKLDWEWDSIDTMQVAEFTSIIVQGRSTDGPITWRIRSDWAELLFVLWAMSRHPQHPQLTDQSWIPRGWRRWATAQGYPPPIVS